MNIRLGYFNTKLGTEDIFKREIWNEILYQDNNDNRVRRVNFATTKI
jgi:hypothetical protein